MKTKRQIAIEQIQLQEEAQGLGLNIVTCGNCGSVLIHRTGKEEIDCLCGQTMALGDCPDLWYEGVQNGEEFNEPTNKEKDLVIEEIDRIIKKHGSFNVFDVMADISPCVKAEGRALHLIEEFRESESTVNVYDPVLSNCEQIYEYDEFYENLDFDTLEYILELAEKWEEINS